MCLRLLLGLAATTAIVRRATDVRELVASDEQLTGRPAGNTRIRQSSEVRVPVTVGLFRPCVLLPEDWREWSTNVAASKDLRTWVKYTGNPILEDNKSSGILVQDGEKYRLYTMHDEVHLHFPE